MANSGKIVSFQESSDCDEDHDGERTAPDSEDCGHESNEALKGERDEDEHEASPCHEPKSPSKPLNPTQIQLIKQRHLQRQSVKIIESLLEATIDEVHLRKSLPLLCKAEMDDVVTERHLISICGYPLCDKTLTEAFNPRQKFKIDFKNRMLHNYEERIKYCSVLCMKSTQYLTAQMPDEPLWMRYKDSTGYEGLYDKCNIKFYHERNMSDETEPITAVTQAMKKLKVRQVNKSDFVSLPYIKDEHMEELKKSLFTLEIKERSSVDDGDI